MTSTIISHTEGLVPDTEWSIVSRQRPRSHQQQKQQQQRQTGYFNKRSKQKRTHNKPKDQAQMLGDKFAEMALKDVPVSASAALLDPSAPTLVIPRVENKNSYAAALRRLEAVKDKEATTRRPSIAPIQLVARPVAAAKKKQATQLQHTQPVRATNHQFRVTQTNNTSPRPLLPAVLNSDTYAKTMRNQQAKQMKETMGKEVLVTEMMVVGSIVRDIKRQENGKLKKEEIKIVEDVKEIEGNDSGWKSGLEATSGFSWADDAEEEEELAKSQQAT